MKNDRDLHAALLKGIECDVQQGLEALVPGRLVDFAQMRSHVIRQLQQANEASPLFGRARLVQPSFFEQRLKPSIPEKTPKAKVKRLAGMADELEEATVCHVLASFPDSELLHGLLDGAVARLQRFNALKLAHVQVEKAAELGHSKGGKQRRRDNGRLLRLAIRFLRTKAAAGLWMNPSHAADEIGKHLSAIALKHKLTASMSADTWSKNVQKLIGKDSRAAEVFQRHALAQRKNRSAHRPR